jgi:hypothetical protein
VDKGRYETVAEVIRHWKDEKQLTDEEFCTVLNEAINPNAKISLPTYHSWKQGQRNPDYLTFLYLFEHTQPDNWLNDFALQMMMVIRPDIWSDEAANKG